MANYCDYEVHVRGTKKAALFMFACMPEFERKEITHEEGTEEDYIVWMTGNCKWSLDAHCEEKKDVQIDLSQYSEEDIRDEKCGLDYCNLPMQQKSKILKLKVLAHSWSDESAFDQFDVYESGKHVSSENRPFGEYPDYEDYEDEMSYREFCKSFHVDPNQAPPSCWDKEEFPTYREFCKAFGINSSKLPERMWEGYEDILFFCKENYYTFKF